MSSAYFKDRFLEIVISQRGVPQTGPEALELLAESERRMRRVGHGEPADVPPAIAPLAFVPAEVGPDHFHPFTWAPQIIWDTRKRAKNKGLRFGLSAAWVLKRLEKIGYCCELSGIPFSTKKPRNSHKRPWMPSLDRIDCEQGYTPENVRIVCVAVNTLLQDWGDTVFHEIIKASK